MTPSTLTYKVLGEVANERDRQETLRAEGRFAATCADEDGIGDAEKLAILVEEVGEVARQVLTQSSRQLALDSLGTREGLRDELIQVAAVAVAWAEALEP